jgi:hypothetical protein
MALVSESALGPMLRLGICNNDGYDGSCDGPCTEIYVVKVLRGSGATQFTALRWDCQQESVPMRPARFEESANVGRLGAEVSRSACSAPEENALCSPTKWFFM